MHEYAALLTAVREADGRRDAALLTAVREVAGARELLTAQWISLAQKHEGLRSALRAVFKRIPTPQRLGLWLTERLGQQAGDITLHGKYSARAKAWRYAICTTAEIAELDRKAAEAAAAKEAKAAEIRERALKTAEAKLVARHLNVRPNPYVERRKLARQLMHSPKAGAPSVPAPEPDRCEYTTRVDSDGQVHREAPLNCDGTPLQSNTEAPKAAEVPKPANRVEDMRARYLAHHTGIGVGVVGFYDPDGVVSHNMTADSGRVNNYCRVAGKWPGRG